MSGDLADARRRAEEILRRLETREHPRLNPDERDALPALRSLLAAITAEGEAKRTGPRCPFCESDRISRDPALDCWSCETCRRSWGEPPAPQPAPGGKGKDSTGVREAFVAGAAWHEFYEHGATIWTSDRRNAEDEAERRYPTSEWIESPRLTAAEGRVSELESLFRECNAVCLCGCPDSEHESYDEDGESCGDEEHVCIRVAPAVLAHVQEIRANWEDMGERYEALRAQINPPHPSWDTSCVRCGRDVTINAVTCGECLAETPGLAAVAQPAQDAVREAAERLREHVHFEDGEDGEPVAFLGSGFEEAFLTLLAALDAAKGPK